MIPEISQKIKETINNFSEEEEDSIIFNNKQIKIDINNFQPIFQSEKNKEESRGLNKTTAYIDGGQAEIISTGNFCLSFIRVFAQVFENNQKIKSYKNEFYLFTRAEWSEKEIFYESKIFPLQEKIIDEEDLFISSNDSTIKTGTERAPISKIINMARRFAELSLASKVENADFVVLDGTLEPTFKNEEKYLEKLSKNCCALAKSSSLLTTSGNSPVILLNKIGLSGCWSYFVDTKNNFKTYFGRLNEKAVHVFRFEGDQDILPHLVQNCQDALFLGYPYGLIYADKMARVSNNEKKSLMMKMLLKEENKDILDYLTSSNAHDILDNIS